MAHYTDWLSLYEQIVTRQVRFSRINTMSKTKMSWRRQQNNSSQASNRWYSFNFLTKKETIQNVKILRPKSTWKLSYLMLTVIQGLLSFLSFI